jgi:hypothetical protein
MNIGIKEAIEAIAFISGWVAAFTTVKVKNNQALQRLEEIRRRMEAEDQMLNDKMAENERKLHSFREKIHQEVASIKDDNHKFLRSDHAEQKFATKTELKLMIENVSTQYRALSDKIDTLMERLPKNL